MQHDTCRNPSRYINRKLRILHYGYNLQTVIVPYRDHPALTGLEPSRLVANEHALRTAYFPASAYEEAGTGAGAGAGGASPPADALFSGGPFSVSASCCFAGPACDSPDGVPFAGSADGLTPGPPPFSPSPVFSPPSTPSPSFRTSFSFSFSLTGAGASGSTNLAGTPFAASPSPTQHPSSALHLNSPAASRRISRYAWALWYGRPVLGSR